MTFTQTQLRTLYFALGIAWEEMESNCAAYDGDDDMREDIADWRDTQRQIHDLESTIGAMLE